MSLCDLNQPGNTPRLETGHKPAHPDTKPLKRVLDVRTLLAEPRHDQLSFLVKS